LTNETGPSNPVENIVKDSNDPILIAIQRYIDDPKKHKLPKRLTKEHLQLIPDNLLNFQQRVRKHATRITFYPDELESTYEYQSIPREILPLPIPIPTPIPIHPVFITQFPEEERVFEAPIIFTSDKQFREYIIKNDVLEVIRLT
jgi:hypothetical protein